MPLPDRNCQARGRADFLLQCALRCVTMESAEKGAFPWNMTLETIRAAHARIAPYIVQTPLLRLPALDDALGCEVYAKAECMQRTGAFKLRGAMNKILALTDAERARGFVAASSGNHGRAVAYVAQRFGTHACIVMPRDRAHPSSRRPSAHWARSSCCVTRAERFDVAARLCAERGATMVPPFNDAARHGGAGHGRARDPGAVSGDWMRSSSPSAAAGLSAASSTAVKALAPRVRVFGAEPEALPRYTGEPARRAPGAGGAEALSRGRARRAKAGGCVLSVCGRKHRRLCGRCG